MMHFLCNWFHHVLFCFISLTFKNSSIIRQWMSIRNLSSQMFMTERFNIKEMLQPKLFMVHKWSKLSLISSLKISAILLFALQIQQQLNLSKINKFSIFHIVMLMLLIIWEKLMICFQMIKIQKLQWKNGLTQIMFLKF